MIKLIIHFFVNTDSKVKWRSWMSPTQRGPSSRIYWRRPTRGSSERTAIRSTHDAQYQSELDSTHFFKQEDSFKDFKGRFLKCKVFSNCYFWTTYTTCYDVISLLWHHLLSVYFVTLCHFVLRYSYLV